MYIVPKVLGNKATRRGKAAEVDHWRALKHLGREHPLNEDRIRTDLDRLAKVVATLHDDTLRVVEIQLGCLDSDGFQRPVLSTGLLADAIADAREVATKPNDGARRELGHQYAVTELLQYWKGKVPKRPRHPSKGASKFIIWLGEQLVKLDPALDDPNEPEKADRAAWNAHARGKPSRPRAGP